MNEQKSINLNNKIPLGITIDLAVLAAINNRRGREKKSTYINYLLRQSLGLEEAET